MSEPFRFFSLPLEIREIIWKHAIPERIIEFGRPCDPDIPEGDLRAAWVQNRIQPKVMHICGESREIARKVPDDSPARQYPDLQNHPILRDARCWFESTKIVHFNAPDVDDMTMQETIEMMDHLLNLPDIAAIAGKKVSLSADLFHPFIRFHRRTLIDEVARWMSIFKLPAFIVALHTINIKATVEQAHSMGLFSDEPAQLVDPFDMQAVQRYRELWELTEGLNNDPAADKFFDTVDTKRFEFRVQRWLAEIEAFFILWKWGPDPWANWGPGEAIELLHGNPAAREDPQVREFMRGLPNMDLRIMFRLCPPEGWRSNV